MLRRARALLFALLATTTCAAAARHAGADTAAEERARAAYDRGSAAYVRADYALAAKEFARADDALPNAVALRAALDATLRADEPVLGMELLDRAATRPHDDALSAVASTARVRFAHRTGRVHVACGPTACRAAIDGVAFDPALSPYVLVGPHHVTVDHGGALDERVLDVAADAVVEVTPARPDLPLPAPAPPRAAPDGRLSPTWFWIGVGATTALAGLTVASALDTASKHERFGTLGCARVDGDGCASLGESGSSAQRRTNVLIGASALLGVVTATTGLLFVRWGSAEGSASLVPTDRGAVASLRVRF